MPRRTRGAGSRYDDMMIPSTTRARATASYKPKRRGLASPFRVLQGRRQCNHMEAANAAVPGDLESGGGNVDIASGTRPCPADPRLKEKQPFTWLGAVPYAVVVLAGAAMIAVGLLMARSGTETKGPDGRVTFTHRFSAGMALFGGGVALASLAIFVAGLVDQDGGCACDLPRFGPD
ncbi:hypothetical protein ACP70R_045865 [Stipagrostis hirtigluma subsp. patula]